MEITQHALLSRGDLLRTVLVFAVAIAASLWVSFQFLKPIPPRTLVLATGAPTGLYHQYAERYRKALAREGVTLELRETQGAGDNHALLLDPASGVDIAFMQGGVAHHAPDKGIVMLASLYFEPLWIFHHGAAAYKGINEFAGLRIAIGLPGSGTRAFVLPLLAANGITPANATFREVGSDESLRMLAAGEADIAMLVGGGAMEAIQRALRNPDVKLMSVPRAEAYVRRFPHITRLTLPPGTVDLERDIPPQEIVLIATEAMLVAREDLHPALVNLLLEAVRDAHDDQGYFEKAGEFPNTTQVDIPVSRDAVRHTRFGTSFLYRTFPFWVATFLDRTLILVLPLLVVLVPLINFFPQILRWRVRSRVFRWYGELALLEREVASFQGPPPLATWTADLDRIERAVAGIRVPASFASEAYTLREHVGLVRRAIVERAAGAAQAASDP